MVVLDDFQKLLKEVEEIKSRKNKAEGAVEQILKRLRQEFGCKSISEAKRKLEELKSEEQEMFVAYNEARKAFDRKWKKRLEKLN